MASSEKDQVREQIVEAASKLFGRFGYKKTTMDDIAAAVRKGKTGIYYYFENKDDIFRAVIEKEAQMLSDALKSAIGKKNDPVGQLKAYISRRMYTLKNVATFYDALKNELLDQLNFINTVREQYDLEELKLVRNILQDGMKNGFFTKMDTEARAYTIVTALKGLEIPFFVENHGMDLEDRINDLVQVLCYGLIKR